MTANRDIESLMDWWREAGVDTIVADEPTSWFDAAPKNSRPKPPQPPAQSRATQSRPTMPDTLESFQQWWREHDWPGASATGRVAPQGDPASGLMVLLDMPEPGDGDSGSLAGGDVGLLLDRMLAAIGRDRASIYLSSLSPAPIPGGSLSEQQITALADAARRHISLARPRMLLLMGEAPSQALCDSNLAEARGTIRNINHDGGSVAAIATFHPRFLLRQPGLKAESWKDLQLLIEGLEA